MVFKSIFKGIGSFFSGIIKGLTSFFKGVADVFNALATLIPNFPKLLICLVKIIVLAVLKLLLLIPGVDYAATAIIHTFPYLLGALVKIVFPVFMFVFVAVVALVDVVLGNLSGGEPLGLRLHRIVALFNTCLNDPRGWFSVRRWHRNNRYSRLLGIAPCMSPCFDGYEPMSASGGLLCQKMSLEAPDFCTAAAVTRVAEGMPYFPVPRAAVSASDCGGDHLSENQKLLVRLVCQQPDEYDNGFLRVPCFERYCAHPDSKEIGPSTCVNLVPYESKTSAAGQQLLYAVLVVSAGGIFFYTMIESIRAKRDYVLARARA